MIKQTKHRYLMGIPTTSFAIILAWLLTSPLEKIFPQTLIPFLKDIAPIFLSLIVAIMSALATLLNYNELAIRHRIAAQNYHSLWRYCKNWKTDFPDDSIVKEAIESVKQYRERLNDINRNSPQIPNWAWSSVSRQQKQGSTSYKSDED